MKIMRLSKLSCSTDTGQLIGRLGRVIKGCHSRAKMSQTVGLIIIFRAVIAILYDTIMQEYAKQTRNDKETTNKNRLL